MMMITFQGVHSIFNGQWATLLLTLFTFESVANGEHREAEALAEDFSKCFSAEFALAWQSYIPAHCISKALVSACSMRFALPRSLRTVFGFMPETRQV